MFNFLADTFYQTSMSNYRIEDFNASFADELVGMMRLNRELFKRLNVAGLEESKESFTLAQCLLMQDRAWQRWRDNYHYEPDAEFKQCTEELVRYITTQLQTNVHY